MVFGEAKKKRLVLHHFHAATCIVQKNIAPQICNPFDDLVPKRMWM
jgi:type IV pilus biogenesis protein CpaD/CtpE